MDARPMVYDLSGGKLGYDYNFKNIQLLNERLVKAGIRLAKVLKDSGLIFSSLKHNPSKARSQVRD